MNNSVYNIIITSRVWLPLDKGKRSYNNDEAKIKINLKNRDDKRKYQF